jgi:hypothetical protein
VLEQVIPTLRRYPVHQLDDVILTHLVHPVDFQDLDFDLSRAGDLAELALNLAGGAEGREPPSRRVLSTLVGLLPAFASLNPDMEGGPLTDLAHLGCPRTCSLRCMMPWGGAVGEGAGLGTDACVDNCLGACVRLAGYESAVLQVLEWHEGALHPEEAAVMDRARHLQHRRLTFYLGRLVYLSGGFRYNKNGLLGSEYMGGYYQVTTNTGASLKYVALRRGGGCVVRVVVGEVDGRLGEAWRVGLRVWVQGGVNGV